MKISDKLTLVRVFYAPVFAVLFFAQEYSEAAGNAPVWFFEHSFAVLLAISILLIFVEITDYLDGNLARKYNQVDDTGKLLDPFADAFLHITIFFCFAFAHVMNPIAFLIIFYREFGMLFLRMQIMRQGTAISARPGGKLKTVLYIFSIFWTLALMLYEKSDCVFISLAALESLQTVRSVLFTLCALAALLSFIDYIYNFVIAADKKNEREGKKK